jgi:hypothetical protein
MTQVHPRVHTAFITKSVSGATENGKVQTGLYLRGTGWGSL